MSESGQDHEESSLPVVGITMGDAAGIGPEVTLKALLDGNLKLICRPVIIGDARFLDSCARSLDLSANLRPFDADNEFPDDGFEVYDLGNIDESIVPGEESESAGRAAAQNIEASVGLWQDGAIDAVATAPISKHAIALAGYDYPGHTEFYAHLTNTKDFAMSFFAEKLRVVLLSTHVSLVDAISLVKTDALVKLIEFTDKNLSLLLKHKIKIAVAGLNPHASEGGKFGSEERDQITPAIGQCRASGIDVSGPYSPDTIFLRGFRGDFDAVIACYHDQATIAVKSLSFGSSVNVTLGLPIIRTSVDHGTAFDIAGKGVAEASSMASAIKLAAELVNIRKT
ncbi:MAG TPA: 4-hydroxythreonine-4-phosphate dehydrogenase PdxA [Pyrinomonadaceae bacterium]|jgi:4-hydroxythreonine-4-phosphate dehydrogenase|nr:4-hydroxythreonine-4-phosphate dehydrogenase PdxA [Pyrinomonadaceae bacterium]